jgi:hypothetical protein
MRVSARVTRVGGVALCLTALLALARAGAAVNPELFERELKERAREWVTIEVTGAAVTALGDGRTSVTAAAVVREVSRTATALVAGDTILIVYTLDTAAAERQAKAMRERGEQGFAGRQLESLPEVVESGASYKAFLTRYSGDEAHGLVYVPASAAFSFEKHESVPSRP